MDETGVLLSVLSSLEVLASQDDLRSYRGAGVKRTLVTAIKRISADGGSLPPLIIWPAATHRSTWTTHPTPGWHFACSKTGYTDMEISLSWIQHVFDLSTKPRANGKLRNEVASVRVLRRLNAKDHVQKTRKPAYIKLMHLG